MSPAGDSAPPLFGGQRHVRRGGRIIATAARISCRCARGTRAVAFSAGAPHSQGIQQPNRWSCGGRGRTGEGANACSRRSHSCLAACGGHRARRRQPACGPCRRRSGLCGKQPRSNGSRLNRRLHGPGVAREERFPPLLHPEFHGAEHLSSFAQCVERQDCIGLDPVRDIPEPAEGRLRRSKAMSPRERLCAFEPRGAPRAAGPAARLHVPCAWATTHPRPRRSGTPAGLPHRSPFARTRLASRSRLASSTGPGTAACTRAARAFVTPDSSSTKQRELFRYRVCL